MATMATPVLLALTCLLMGIVIVYSRRTTRAIRSVHCRLKVFSSQRDALWEVYREIDGRLAEMRSQIEHQDATNQLIRQVLKDLPEAAAYDDAAAPQTDPQKGHEA